MKRIIFFLTILLFSSFVYAQESVNLEDELFGDGEDTLVSEEESATEALSKSKLNGDLNDASLALESKNFRIGGGLNSGLSLSSTWMNPYSKKDDYWKSFKNPASKGLYTNLGANLFFDARPTENLKLFGKFLFNYPFEKTFQGSGSTYFPAIPMLGMKEAKEIPVSVQTKGIPYFKIHELYTDFSAKDIAFFRFGKHTVKWGTGYFYSPADVLNISRIDPQDPSADREGPISLRSHIIIPKTQHNIWLYLLPPTQKDNSFDPKYTAGAMKGEFVFGDWELGLGGFYKYEKAPRLITTLSGSIAGEVSVFAEGVFAWESDYTYHNDNADFSIKDMKNKPFFQATLGGSYSNKDSHTSISMQYYYNGFGYKNPSSILSSAEKIIKENNKLKAKQIQAARNAYTDILSMGQYGQHYIAFNLSQNKLGTDKLSLNLFQQFEISELSGTSVLTLNWKIYKFVRMSTGPIFTYPLSSKAYTKGSIGYKLSFTLGGGRF